MQLASCMWTWRQIGPTNQHNRLVTELAIHIISICQTLQFNNLVWIIKNGTDKIRACLSTLKLIALLF